MSEEAVDVCLIFAIYMSFLVLSQCNNLTRLLNGLNRSSSSTNFVTDDSIQLQRGNLDSSLINSLPLCEFKKNEREQIAINADCAICLGEFEEGELLKLLPNCSHGFHVSCIDTWFQSHSNCPLCRSRVTHDFVANPECSVSLYTLLQGLRREDFSTERAAHFQSIPSESLQNLEIRHEPCPD
ncbi:RING-H2 finger protein ATL66-like [Abrus precatorius]|uniref:RING-type E3 ubiquitin transferase n=1 Tax=Abrus precatorius TaxID=3816 RepID=A0A8B8KJF0_ABRPR|nr:RING-H2 finger protein ATL66-like [Abrus precatorius]